MSVAAGAISPRPLVLSDLIPGGLVKDAALVAGGAAITGVFAQISVPVHGSPVPITGQTFAVLVVGAALGWRRGFLSLALYMLAGMAGVPWYAHHAHGFHMPDFGYIIGFVVAATIVGALAGRRGDRTPVRVIGTMIVGNLAVYAVGVPYLMADLHLTFSQAWAIGMKDYLVGDGVKMLLAAGVLPAAWRIVRSRDVRSD